MFVEEIFHVLGMTFNFDDDVAIMFFDLVKRKGPISLNKFFFFRVNTLKEHVWLVIDLESSDKLDKAGL